MRRIFYSYDEHGLGPVRRSVGIAPALSASQRSSILLVAGARAAALFRVPEGTDTPVLPAPRTDFTGIGRGPSLGLHVRRVPGMLDEVLAPPGGRRRRRAASRSDRSGRRTAAEPATLTPSAREVLDS